MLADPQGFEALALPPGGHAVRVGALPPALIPAADQFEALWDAKPAERPRIHIHGREIEIPRWQQAYGRDYRFSGQVSAAVPVPGLLAPLLAWARAAVDGRLDGLLLNWYAPPGDYIGAHRDSRHGMVDGAPIVTISLGGSRTFRLRPHRGCGYHDVPVGDGTVIVLPFDTNLAFTHEVVKPRRHEGGRRVSITMRAFAPGESG